MNLLRKHDKVIKAAIDYWVNNVPTGLTDQEYNELEQLARLDGIEPREEAFKLLRGSWVPNESYITSIPKHQVKGSMYDAVWDYFVEGIDNPPLFPVYGDNFSSDKVAILKYDGSSVVCYYENGKPIRVVTAGGENKNGDGVDQTWKLLKYFPEIDPRIKALHCECLVSLEHGLGPKSRFQANGLINSTKDNMLDKVDELINIRAFRYFSDYNLDYVDTMRSLPKTYNDSGDIKFAAGDVWTVDELLGEGSPLLKTKGEIEKDEWKTSTGTFLVDGIVFYSKIGEVQTALKYESAGRNEFTEVINLVWSDQARKGKDSFFCNAVIDQIEVRGSKVTKPSCPVGKLIKDGLGVGSLVSVILASSTIPKVDRVLTKSSIVPLPICPCGTEITLDSVFGNNLKCPNPDCSYRYQNMTKYLETGEFDTLLEGSLYEYYSTSSLNRLFIIDRFDFSKKISDKKKFGKRLYEIVSRDEGPGMLRDLINQLGLTNLQLRNLELVYKPAYKALRDRYLNLINKL